MTRHYLVRLFMLATEFSIPVSVEVSLSHVLQGIFEIEGLLTYADEILTVEYQANELLSRTSRVETVELSLDALREVTFKRKVTGSTITVLPKRLSAFEDVQIAENAQIVLKVKRLHRQDAAALVSHLQRVISYKSSAETPGPIPFRGGNVGLRRISGTLFLEGDECLVLDVRNALVGGVDSEQQLIKVAPRALKEVRLARGGQNDRLYVRPKNRNLLEAMPGAHKDELELKIHRKHRDSVERLIYDLTRLSSLASAPPDENPDVGDAS